LLEELEQDLRDEFTLNIHDMLDYKPLQELQILNGKNLKQRATHTSLSLPPREPQNERASSPLSQRDGINSATPPIYRPFKKWLKFPCTRSYNTSSHRGIFVNTWSSPLDGCASIEPSHPLDARISIMPHVTLFEASQRAQIPSPPIEPLVLALWRTKQPNDFVVNRRKPHKLDVASTPSFSWLDSHVILAQCWFCGVNQSSPTCRLWLLAATLHWLQDHYFVLLFLPHFTLANN
jgi:hypothetical protein